MTTIRKVSILAIQQRAARIVATTGGNREEVLARLKAAHEGLGIEIDLGSASASETDLNFADTGTKSGEKPDFAKTQPFPKFHKFRQNGPLQL